MLFFKRFKASIKSWISFDYHTTKLLTENVLETEMRKAQIIMNKSVY